MNRFARWRTGWLGVGVLAALLGGLALPSSARASCGDYVHLSTASDQSSSSANRAHTPAKTTAAPGGHRLPCSGPNCSHRSRLPAPEPVAPVVVGGEQWASLATAPLPELPQPVFALFDSRLGPTVRGVLAIFHPPRPLSAARS